MKRAMRSLSSPARVVALALVLVNASSCRRGRSLDERAPDSMSRERGQASTGPIAQPSKLPVVITLRRELLGLPPGAASTDSTIAAMQRAMRELATVAKFEVLAMSPAILAVNVRATDPPDAVRLARILSGHRLVASAEVDGMATKQQ